MQYRARDGDWEFIKSMHNKDLAMDVLCRCILELQSQIEELKMLALFNHGKLSGMRACVKWLEDNRGTIGNGSDFADRLRLYIESAGPTV